MIAKGELLEQMKINHIKGNTYYIETKESYIPIYKMNNREIILLDSGRPRNERAIIYQTLEENNLVVSGIICSHAHVDHVGNNEFFKGKYNSIIAMTSYEAGNCNTLLGLKSFNYLSNVKSIESDFGDMLCHTDIKITEEQTSVTLCNINFEVIHTPGHSAAHICIITPDNVAYLGDLLLDSKILRSAKLPYSYCHLADLHSKKGLYHLKADKYVIAHKGVYEEIDSLITENISIIKSKAQAIQEMLSEGLSLNTLIHRVINQFHIKIDTPKKYLVVERNLRPYIDYLLDKRMIYMKYVDGDIHYYKKQKS